MIIQCPRCSTRWRVAETSPGENPVFKCGKCHNLFRRFPGAPAATEPRLANDRSRAPSPEPDNLEFIFPATPSGALEEHEAAATLSPAESSPPAAPVIVAHRDAVTREKPPAVATTAPTVDARVEPVVAAIAAEDGERGPIAIAADSDPDPEGDVEAGAPDDEVDGALAVEEGNEPDAVFAADEFEVHDAEGDLEGAERDLEELPTDAAAAEELRERGVLRVAPPPGPRHAFIPIVATMSSLVAGFALLALVIHGVPDVASRWLARLPLVGSAFAEERVLARKITLRNVRGGYQRLRNTRRVFVISGDAVNNSASAIERIEVEGVLYDMSGEVEQKVVNAGNRTTLTDLSDSEVTFLQGLDPRSTLAPGESTPFLIVFLEPPRDLREFSSRVLSVRSTRRAASPAGLARPPASAG